MKVCIANLMNKKCGVKVTKIYIIWSYSKAFLAYTDLYDRSVSQHVVVSLYFFSKKSCFKCYKTGSFNNVELAVYVELLAV